nr:hypothetical protein [uncultured Brevundimonas sp.]
MKPDVEVFVALAALMQSSVAHFLMPTDISEEASAWLLSQGIQHDLNDLYIMGLQPTGGTLISIADPKAALAFRMWGDSEVLGPLAFSQAASSVDRH